MGLKWKFQRDGWGGGGGGGLNQKTFRGRGMDIFWNNTLYSSRKYPYRPHGGSKRNSEEVGGLKSQNGHLFHVSCSPSGKGAGCDPLHPSEISGFKPPSPLEFPVTFHGGDGGGGVWILSGTTHCVMFLGKTLYSHNASLHPGLCTSKQFFLYWVGEGEKSCNELLKPGPFQPDGPLGLECSLYLYLIYIFFLFIYFKHTRPVTKKIPLCLHVQCCICQIMPILHLF